MIKMLEEEIQTREIATASSMLPPKKPVKGPVTAAVLLVEGSDTGSNVLLL